MSAPAATPVEHSRSWRPGVAVVWRCPHCGKTLGLVDGPLLRVQHMGRVVEAQGHTFAQVCDQCKQEARWTVATG